MAEPEAESARPATPAGAIIKQALEEHARQCSTAKWTAEEHNRQMHKLIINRLAARVDELEGQRSQDQREEQELLAILDQEETPQEQLNKLAADIVARKLAIGTCEKLVRKDTTNTRLIRNVARLMLSIRTAGPPETANLPAEDLALTPGNSEQAQKACQDE